MKRNKNSRLININANVATVGKDNLQISGKPEFDVISRSVKRLTNFRITSFLYAIQINFKIV